MAFHISPVCYRLNGYSSRIRPCESGARLRSFNPFVALPARSHPLVHPTGLARSIGGASSLCTQPAASDRTPSGSLPAMRRIELPLAVAKTAACAMIAIASTSRSAGEEPNDCQRK
jgi:hypothetical protein